MASRRGGTGSASRLTKAERKEEARREREEIHRQIARRRRNRVVYVAVAVVVAVAIVGAVVLTSGSGIPSPKELLASAKSQERAASCTKVQTVPPFDRANVTGSVPANAPEDAIDRDHIGGQYDPTPPPLSAYPSVPPASGPHAPLTPGPEPAGVYPTPPDIYRAIHDLEHGAAIVWYSPNAPAGDIQAVKDFFSQRQIDQSVGQDRVLVAPYSYPAQGKAGRLPGGVQMALVAWHRMETCGRVDLAAAFDFTSQYSARLTQKGVVAGYPGRPYLGEAPEAGSAL